MSFCCLYVIGSLSIKANAIETYYPDTSEMTAYHYFISKGLTKLNTSIAQPASSDGTPLAIESWTGSYYNTGGQIFLYQKVSSSYVTYPWISGTYNNVNRYDENCVFTSYYGIKNLYLEFFSSQPISNSTCYSQPGSGIPARPGLAIITERVEKNGGGSLYHYLIKFEKLGNSSSVNLNFVSNNVSVVPVMMKLESQLTNDERLRCGLKTIEGQTLDSIRTQDKEQFEKQIAQSQKEHDEKMDTSKANEVVGIAQDLQEMGNEKTESLLYPIQWAITTAHNLASAPSTGTISIPVIFGSGSFEIDMTVLERNVPSVWLFIQNFIRFIVALGILRGIFGLFKGVDG